MKAVEMLHFNKNEVFNNFDLLVVQVKETFITLSALE
jgi:hypothetical protein